MWRCLSWRIWWTNYVFLSCNLLFINHIYQQYICDKLKSGDEISWNVIFWRFEKNKLNPINSKPSATETIHELCLYCSFWSSAGLQLSIKCIAAFILLKVDLELLQSVCVMQSLFSSACLFCSVWSLSEKENVLHN